LDHRRLLRYSSGPTHPSALIEQQLFPLIFQQYGMNRVPVSRCS